MLQRTTLQQPSVVQSRYVYVKMLIDNVDVTEGKCPKGAVIAIPEDKASRWCFRSKVARPATQAEYDRYNDKMQRQRGGGVRRPSRGIQIPDENPFHYVDAQTPEYDDEEDDEEYGMAPQPVSTGARRRRVPRQEINDLGSRMAATENNFENASEPDEEEETSEGDLELEGEEEESEEEASEEEESEEEEDITGSGGVYDAAISRGPMDNTDPTESRGRGRRGRRNR